MSTHSDQEIYIYYAQMWAMNFHFITGLFYIMATICFLIYFNDSFWNKKKSIYFYLVSNSLANLRQKSWGQLDLISLVYGTKIS